MQIMLLALLSLLLLLPGSSISDNRIKFTSGFVAAVGVEVDEDGHPMLAEYDSDGRFVADVGYLGLGELEEVSLYPAASWRAFELFQQNLQSSNPIGTQGATLMSAEQYQEGAPFMTNETSPQVVTKPALFPGTKSVYVIAEDRMFNPAPEKDGFILAEYPIALHEGNVPADAVTLLLDQEGKVVRASNYDISFKAAVYKEGGRQANTAEDRLWQPLPNVRVDAGDRDMNLFPGGQTVSGADGRYQMSYAMPPCPGFSYSLDIPIIATLDIENFNPKKDDGSLGFMVAYRNAYKTCVGYGDVLLGTSLSALNAQLNAQAIVATIATPLYHHDITFSTMQLNAIGTMPGVRMTENTVYTEDSAVRRLNLEEYDFDFNLDGIPDTVVANPGGADKVDIYISPNAPGNEPGPPNPPDFTRLADYALANQLGHQGLLSEISQQDLEDTDIYIYRRSTGQLLGTIEGLAERQQGDGGPVHSGNIANPKGRATYRGVHTEEESGTDIATFGFTSFLVGAVSDDFRSRIDNYWLRENTNRRPWLPTEGRAGGFTSDNPPDGLRPGEVIQVIAINRATGYIGSQNIVTQSSGVTLSPPSPILMGPPNLKIIASREFEDFNEISRSNDQKINIIGSEGAGLTSDTYVKIQTVWLAQNGDVLPDDLPGYTGRLAISTGSGTSDFSGNFEIKPGYQTQVVQLNNASELVTEHFYVQVVGEHFEGTPTFESPGAGEGKLQTRPKKYVPLLVPLFDEVSTRAAEEALAIARLEGIENLPERVEPTYRWVYRPEMQFSVYELAVNELNAVRESDNNQQDIVNLVTQDLPVISSDTSYVDLLYDIFGNGSDPLEKFGSDGELVFAFGEDELLATVGQGGILQFDSIDHLSSIAVEDFLSFRLFTNNDAANILWEFTFEHLVVFAPEDSDLNADLEDFWYVTADDPKVRIAAALIGYSSRDSDLQEPRTIRWSAEGDGSFTVSEETSTTGYFETEFTIPTTAGSEAIIRAEIEGSDTIAEWRTVVLIPGEPASISLSRSGATAVQGNGTVNFSATVNDIAGNAVLDGTPVGFFVNGDAVVRESQLDTVDGRATAKVSGGYYSTGTHSLTVEAGDISSNLSFNVSNYSINVGLPATVLTNQNYSIPVSISALAGVSPEDVYVDAYTSHGRVSRNQLLTDSSGNLSLNWHTGSLPSNAELIFRTAGDQTQKVSTSITLPSNGNSIVTVEDPALIGDVAISNSIDFIDLRDVFRSINYSSRVVIDVNGAPLASKNLQLGTLRNPNRAPLLAFSAANNREENSLYEITRRDTSEVLDHPIGVGRSIKLDTAQSTIEFAATSAISPQAPVVSLQAKFLSVDTTDDLVNINDAFVIAYRNQRVKVIADTTAGLFELESQILSEADWHTIDAALTDGILRLEVDNQVNELAAPGSITYSASRDITLDGAVNYQLASLKIFDKYSAPLALFDNGLETIDVVLDATGSAETGINSTGKMHDHVNGSQLSITFVDIESDGELHTINVISKNHYAGLAKIWVNATDRLPTFSEIAALTIDQHLYQDTRAVAEKALTITADHEMFSAADRLMNLLAVIDQVPQTNEIGNATQKLLTHFRTTDQMPIVFATVDIVGLAIKQALQGDRTALDELVLPLTVFGELVESSSTVADYMASTIKSKDDLHYWFELFKFPALGWLGLEPPVPDLENTDCNSLPQNIYSGKSYAMSSVPCRLTGQKMADWVEDLALSDNFYLTQPQRFSHFVKSLVENLPVSPTLIRRNAFVTESDLTAMNGNTLIQPAHAGAPALLRPLKYLGKLGSRSAKNTYLFFLGKANHRIDPLLMLYVFYYLETRTNPNSACTGSCQRIDVPGAQAEVNSKISKVLNNIARAGKLRDQSYTKDGELKCGLVQTSHGDMFELMALAYFHADYELTRDPKKKVVDIERSNEVLVLTKDSSNNIIDERSYIRRADIVLAGSGTEDKGLHIELKSMQAAQSKDENRGNAEKRDNWLKKKWPLWSLKSRRTSYHRQFVLDHFKTANRKDESGEGIETLADDFVWYFHTWSDFEAREVKRPRKRTVVFDPGVPLNKNGRRGDTDFDRLKKHVFKANSDKEPRTRLEASLGVTALPKIDNEFYHMSPVGNGDKVKLFNWQTLLMENAALSAQLTIPEEVRQQWFEIVNNNELQLALDIIENYEEIDVLPDIDVDNAWDRVVEKLEGFALPFSECDP